MTVIRDAAGRFFASFVVEVGAEPLPEVDAECGIDLGLTHFAVMDDGTKIASPLAQACEAGSRRSAELVGTG